MIFVRDWSESGDFEEKVWESFDISNLRKIRAIFIVKNFQGLTDRTGSIILASSLFSLKKCIVHEEIWISRFIF